MLCNMAATKQMNNKAQARSTDAPINLICFSSFLALFSSVLIFSDENAISINNFMPKA